MVSKFDREGRLGRLYGASADAGSGGWRAHVMAFGLRVRPLGHFVVWPGGGRVEFGEDGYCGQLLIG